MKLLIIAGEELNKENTYSSVFELHQAIALKERGIDVAIISLSLKGSIYSRIKQILFGEKYKLRELLNLFFFAKSLKHNINDINVYERIGYRYIPGRFRSNADIKRIGLKAFKSYVKHEKLPDLIHAHSRFLTSAIIALKIKKKHNLPVLITEHSSHYARNLISEEVLCLTKKLYTEADKIIAVSSTLANILATRIGIKLPIVIPNVLDPNYSNQVYSKNLSHDFIFLAIGTFDLNKNHELLIKSFSKAFNGNLGFKLIIVGNGVLESHLKFLILTLGLSNQVRILGHQSRNEIKDLIIKSHVMISTSKIETFGVVLIEALAFGKPIISSKSGGPEDIINEYNGILFKNGDTHSLGKAMIYMHSNYKKYNHQKIIDNCNRDYGPKNIAIRLEELYLDTIKEYINENKTNY